MHTIAVVNEKGGTGKTTTAVNLAAALGEMQKKVLLVDLDGQAASSRWLGVEEDTSFADALYAGKGLAPILDVIPNVSLCPASGKLDAVAHDLRPTQGGQLRRLLSEVSNQFEFVIIDCPPSLGNRLIGNALIASSHAVVPVETSVLALDGLKILLTTLEDVREGFGHNIILAGVLACRFDSRTKLSRLILAELQRALPGRVFQTVIRENVRMRECPASGQSIIAYAPDSHAAEDYRNLAKELLASPWLNAVGQEQADASGSAAFMAAEKDQHLGDSLRQSVRKGQGGGEDDSSEWKKRLQEAQERLSGEGVASSQAQEAVAPEAAEVPQQPAPVAEKPVAQEAAETPVQAETAPVAFEMPPIAEVPQALPERQDEPAITVEPKEPATIESQPAAIEAPAAPETDSQPIEIPAPAEAAPAAPEAPPTVAAEAATPATEAAVWIDPVAGTSQAPANEQVIKKDPSSDTLYGWSGTRVEPETSAAAGGAKSGWQHAVTGAESNGHNGHNGHGDNGKSTGQSGGTGILPPAEPAWEKPASNAPVSGEAGWLELITGGTQTPPPLPDSTNARRETTPAVTPASAGTPGEVAAASNAAVPDSAAAPAMEGHPDEFAWGSAGGEQGTSDASPDCPHLRKYLAQMQGQGQEQRKDDKESQQSQEPKSKGLLGRIFARSR